MAAKTMNWTFVLLWALANAIGFAVVGAGFHNFELATPWAGRLGSFDLAAAVFGAFMGFVPSLLIGWLQSRILRRSIPVSRWWIVTVSAGIGLNHFIADGYPYARDPLVGTLAAGAVVGVLQWLVLRKQFQSFAAWTWIPLSSWYLGVLVGASILDASGLLRRSWTPSLGFQQHGLVGLVLGAIYGILTGIVMLGFLRRRSLVETRTQPAPALPLQAGP